MAERASLWEDLFEWTDLRVKYPGLKRNNGARIQVKLIGTEAVENDTINNSKRRDFYVIVSPVGLANYIEQRYLIGVWTSWLERNCGGG